MFSFGYKANLIRRLTVLSLLAASQHLFSAEVNIYSYREPQLIQPLLKAFTKKTGIKLRAINAKSGLIERLQVEAEQSPADLLLTTDISSLTDVKAAGLTQAVNSNKLTSAIPAHLRDSDGHWFGLTKRARVIVASVDQVKRNEIQTYDQLADPKWKTRICTRSGKHKYMLALFQSQLVHQGRSKTPAWLTGLKNNLARKPQGNDRAQIRAVASGQCDLALVNHYYMFVMLNDPKQAPDARKVNVIFPNQKTSGTHMNTSGMALAKHSPNPKQAIRLMEFLASPEGQKIYVNLVGEYPVVKDVPLNKLLRGWGSFREDKLDLETLASKRAEALALVNKVGYDK